MSSLRIFLLNTKLAIANADTQLTYKKTEYKISILLPARAGFFVIK